MVTIEKIKDIEGNVNFQTADSAEYTFIPSDSLIMLPVEDVHRVIQEPDHTPLKTIDGKGALCEDLDSRWASKPMPWN